MASVAERRTASRSARIPAWLPLAVLPATALLLGADSPRWIVMCLLAFAVYAGLKWLTFADCAEDGRPSVWRSLAYLLLWPGMDAKSFFTAPGPIQRPTSREWLLASAKVICGVFLVVVAVSLVNRHALLAGWIGMAGMVFTLHFGLFHLLSVFWRQAGIHAPPIMNAPVMASSLSDFWGRRWNLAFRDLSHVYVFRPSVGRLGVTGSAMAVFLVSGVVHDLVISVPSGAGFGLPTLYFTIQGVGLLLERSLVGKRIGLGKPVVGRMLCAVVVLAPVVLLFHPPFVEQVIVPMLQTLGTL